MRSPFDTVDEAVASKAWQTLVDEAGEERFIDDVSYSRVADVIRSHRVKDTINRWRNGGFVACGDDAYVDVVVSADSRRETDAVMGVDMVAAAALPSRLVVIVDPDAVGRNPEFRAWETSARDWRTLPSPVYVDDPDGVVVLNVGED